MRDLYAKYNSRTRPSPATPSPPQLLTHGRHHRTRVIRRNVYIVYRLQGPDPPTWIIATGDVMKRTRSRVLDGSEASILFYRKEYEGLLQSEREID